jgi:hypothetical protein
VETPESGTKLSLLDKRNGIVFHLDPPQCESNQEVMRVVRVAINFEAAASIPRGNAQTAQLG